MNNENKTIDHPYINSYCDKCENHYLLGGDESRCMENHLGLSDTMCAQINEYGMFEEKDYSRTIYL